MPSLAELQTDLSEFLLGPPGNEPPPSLPAALRNGGAPAAERLAVYKNNVYSRLVDALVQTFPAVVRLVGAAFFRYAALEYIALHAPRSPSLLGYGDRFAEFLAQFAPAASVPYLADIAALEFNYLEAYHAPEAATVDAETFRSMLATPEDAARIVLHPSTRLMQSRFPVSRIWEINCRPDPIEANTKIAGEAEWLFIVRPQATVEVRRTSPGAHAALRRLAAGGTLRESISEGERAESGLDVQSHLAALAAGGSFCITEHAR